MNSSVCYLGVVLEMLVRSVLEDQKELQETKEVSDAPGFDEGVLEGYYIVIRKLFKAAASISIFKTLPEKLQENITAETLVEDLKKGYVKRMLQLRKAFRETQDSVAYGDIDLKTLFEEIITEAQTIENNLTSYFDLGMLRGYSFCFDTLYVQAEINFPELFKKLPKKLRKLDPEFIGRDTVYRES